MRSISSHVRANLIAYLALFFALGGTAVASHEQIFSSDIVNGEVRNADLAANSVASGKIDDRQVKNADLSIGASSSNTIRDGGIQGVDVQDESLTGTQIDESGLDKVPEADKLDGIDSSGFIHGGGQALGGFGTVAAGEFFKQIVLIDASATGNTFSVVYSCPPDPSDNGAMAISNRESAAAKLFIDNGSGNPSFSGDLTQNSAHTVPATASGEYITFQARFPSGRIVTVDAFSQHDPASDSCYAQAQAVVTKP